MLPRCASLQFAMAVFDHRVARTLFNVAAL